MSTHNTIHIDSLKLSYRDQGEGRTPLLFLHGAGVTAYTYRQLITRFAKSYRVIAPDIPGFGHSSAPKTIWNYDDYAAFFTHVLNALNLEDVIVVGHSFGGSIALHLAAQSSRIKKAIAMNATGLPTSYQFSEQVYRFAVLKTMRSYVKEGQGLPMTRTGGDFVNNLSYNIRSLPKMVRIVRNCILSDSDFYTRVRVPVLLLSTTRDELVPVSDVKEAAELFKNASVQIVDGNHDWYLSKPNEVVENIDAFIKMGSV